ncbi:MAG TPA: glutamate synthase-related protein [Candidatus Eisenbacteria bacterium]|nr:glutamate synthase-related protein [Candidatus Eisenbacteria bacterium]
MTVGLERWSREIAGADLPASELQRLLGIWEDVLGLVVDPKSPAVAADSRARTLLPKLLELAGMAPDDFWAMPRGKRGRWFLQQFSRNSRDVPALEMSAFDLDKAAKERFRREPLTLGSAWHYGLWRSYFSHAAITHPANDGLREEFSTAWDLVRKEPAVLFREASGVRTLELSSVRLDMPILVGPMPFGDGVRLETAYLRAVRAEDPAHDLKTRTLVVVRATDYLAHTGELSPYAEDILPRFTQEDLARLKRGDPDTQPWAELLARARVAEIVWHEELAGDAAWLSERWPQLLLSVYIRYFGGFWAALAETVRVPGVAVVQVHSGELKSYRLIPRVDAFLKDRLDRARVQLVSVGGDTDTIASAAAVYEAVLLGANGGAATHLAVLALAPEFADVLTGGDPAPYVRGLAARGAEELYEEAVNTLSCWQHSILDFLSCMGIDDVQKTSGNTMAITITEDWAREVDALATPDFAATNRELNTRRVAAEPVPADVRERYRVTSLLRQVKPGLPLVHAARIQDQHTANWHLMNSNRSLTGDFLEVAYRMAAGHLPVADDFFLEGDMGSATLDGVRLSLKRSSLEWALERLHRDATLLDYVQLAVPRGFHRPGALRPGARSALRLAGAEVQAPSKSGNGGTPEGSFATWTADRRGGFEVRIDANAELASALERGTALEVVGLGPDGDQPQIVALAGVAQGAAGASIARASVDGAIVLKRHPAGGYVLSGLGVREPIWQAPIAHASISLGAASEDFLTARIEGNAGIAMVSSGEGGPIRLTKDEDMSWESMQAASGHFGIHAADLRRVRDVEIKINQGAKPGKGGRLAGAKVTAQVSKARNIPVGTDALSPDPKHDIYSIEDMPAEVWLWLLYHTHCGIKITGSNYTRYVAAGMWSNFVVDYLLVDSGLGGSGNYHADSSHVGWPDIFRTILHTHHALVSEKVDLDGSGELRPIRDLNGVPFGAGGGTRLFASGGMRGELDFLKVLIAGADGVVVASIDKAVAFGCNQCGNCHLDCPRGGITTKLELTSQNDRAMMRDRFRNWIALSLVKLAVLVDAINYESGALNEAGMVRDRVKLIRDIRELRGRLDLVRLPQLPAPQQGDEPVVRPDSVAAVEHDSCRVGSLTVSEPVDVGAIWEAAKLSYNGGNNRGGGIGFAGFAPPAVAGKTAFLLNTIGPDRAETTASMLDHFEGCRFFDASGGEMARKDVARRLPEFRVPVRAPYADEEGWRRAGLRENVGDFSLFFVEARPDVLERYAHILLSSAHWLPRHTRFGDLADETLLATLRGATEGDARLAEFPAAVREEYFSVLAHILDSRYYRTHGKPGAAAGKYADKRRGFVVSVGEDMGSIKISGWTHVIPEYFDFERFWAGYPGAAEHGGVEVTQKGRTFRTTALHAHVWGMHHRYPTNSPAIDAEGRGNPAGAHPFKAYNVLLMHNGEQVGVDSTAPFLAEYGTVHPDESMGPGAIEYAGDSLYERKALTDTEYAAYLVDFTRRVLGLGTEEATQIISPITGLDLEAMPEPKRSLHRLLATNYVQLTPTGPYKFTILETRPGGRVGFRENMDIKFLRPHEVIVHRDEAEGGVKVAANGSEAKIADSMLRVLHAQGVLGDAAADLRFNMRPGGRPGQREFGGVVEAFVRRGVPEMTLVNRFGEDVVVERAGTKVDLATPLGAAAGSAASSWRGLVDEYRDRAAHAAEESSASGRLFGPEDDLPAPAQELVETALERVGSLSFGDYRYLVEDALPSMAKDGDAHQALALRMLTELRKRLVFSDLGGKALSSMEYLTDGGRARDGSPEGGIYRILDAVPAFGGTYGRARLSRITFATRDDLVEPADPARDVLVVDFRDFESVAFSNACASRFVSEATQLGWRHFIAYNFIGGPRYLGTNLTGPDGAPARAFVMELYGREFGDFLGALLEGGRMYAYGQGQSHAGFKADSGRLFLLQDALNTCAYAAHGFMFSAWDTGSRFAVAGQNKVALGDDTPAQGFKSLHMGSPNEYAFEYLMSGGDNSCHIVLGLAKPDRQGHLALRPRPYAGKFFMSGAAAGRVFVLDPERRLEPEQYRGNVIMPISPAEWARDVVPLLETEARLRGAPMRADADSFSLRLGGEWRRWPFAEAFSKLVPSKVAAKMVTEPTPEALVQIVGE